ncbi:MAG TPA: sulfurtransferase [Micromonosporaceae bacterium]|nr:sulfurtransferase [Micromonosporaceae bacterium]
MAAAIVPPAVPGAARATAVPTVLDVRWRLGGPPGRNEYRAGHIPRAAFIDLDAELSGPPGAGGRHPLPDVTTLQAALRAAGVSASRPVVVYDAGDGMPAARLWWTLRWAGHPDVRVLDGGFGAWERAGRPIEVETDTETTLREAGDITVVSGHVPLLDADAAAAYGRRGALLDARAPERFRGETEPIDPIAGHIPGAANVPYADLVNADGTFRPAADLRERFARAGIDESGEFGAYCGSGVTAAHTVLAADVAGLPTPALYVGSWSEWITDPSRPIATEAARPIATDPDDRDGPAETGEGA